jgi:hypothetical protein
VLARVEGDALVLDLRTVEPIDDVVLVRRITEVVRHR